MAGWCSSREPPHVRHSVPSHWVWCSPYLGVVAPYLSARSNRATMSCVPRPHLPGVAICVRLFCAR